MSPDLETAVAALLEAAQTAYSVDEAEALGGSTAPWPQAYAAYLLASGLPDLLPRTVAGDPNALASQLQDLEAAFRHDDPSGDWVVFAARRLVAAERTGPQRDAGTPGNAAAP
jgi:hypothetical protein